MVVKGILNYFSGYVNIKVEGFFIERFINMCTSKKILLMDIKREKSSIMYAKVGVSDYKRLRQVAKKTKSKVKIQNKKGLPFLAHKYRKRKIFAFLFGAIILAMIVLSNFIWNIEIQGNSSITKQEIVQTLEKNGLTIGTSKNNIDTNSIINQIRLQRDDIAWMGITVKGTNAIVKIKEIDKAPTVIDENKYCDIVADKTGIITKIDVQNGTAAVKIGDIVEKGTVLVNGYLEGKYTGIRNVHSVATIEARIWYTKRAKEPLEQQILEETGKQEKKYSIKFKKNQINLFKTLSNFQKYDTINESKKLTLFSNFYLPIELIKITNKEQISKQKIYTQEELVNKITNQLKQELEQEIKDKEGITNINVNTYAIDESVEVEVTYEVLEKIGIEQEINI